MFAHNCESLQRSRHVLRRLSATLLLALASSALTAEDSAVDPKLEVRQWLQGYLRIDTTNPPGNEAAAAAYLARILHREGIPTQTIVTPEGRANHYARLESGNPNSEAVILLVLAAPRAPPAR